MIRNNTTHRQPQRMEPVGNLRDDLVKLTAVCAQRMRSCSVANWLMWHEDGAVYFSAADGAHARYVMEHQPWMRICEYHSTRDWRIGAEQILEDLQDAAERARKTIAELAAKFGRKVAA